MAPSSENQKFETDNLIVGRTEPEINENQKFKAENIITGSTEPKIDKQKKFDTVNLLTGRTETENKVGIGNFIKSISAARFTAEGDDADTFGPINYDATYTSFAANFPSPLETGTMYADVDLPHGAVITEVIVYGGETTGTNTSWLLRRQKITSVEAPTTMAGADRSVADTSITTPTIDNGDYSYFLQFTTGDGDEPRCYGARIKYTIS